MTHWPEHIAATTCHTRRGGPGNVFRYDVDYVLIDPEERQGPGLFSRNRFNLTTVLDRNHGARQTMDVESTGRARSFRIAASRMRRFCC